MSVVGIDLGNVNSVIAVARNRGVDIICNEVSNRTTPSLVSFGSKSRYLGESAKTQEISNFRNTVASLKRILGRPLNDPLVEAEKEFLNCELVEKDGQVAAKVSYLDEETVFSGTELMAMFLSKLREITTAECKNTAMDVVLSVPAYYNDFQRRALLDAAVIADVNCVRLMNETTSSALAYGMPKADLPEDKPRVVCFVDMGQSALTVSIVSFTKGHMVVKGVGFDEFFGGRNFDQVLVDHFCAELMATKKLDVRSNKKALFRLRAACERVKKVLSANAKTNLHVENLMNDIDVSAEIDRATFEQLCQSLVERVDAPIARALAMAGLTLADVNSVELVGGSTRVPMVKERLTKIFGLELLTTLNQDEAIARGCALQCALQSPVFKVREFSVQEITYFPIKFAWEPSPETPEDVEYEVFPVGNQIPSTKLLSFKRQLPFTVFAQYSGSNVVLGSFAVMAPAETYDLATSTIKIKTRLNPQGVCTVEGASIVNDEDANIKIDLKVQSMTFSLAEGELEKKYECEAHMCSSDKLVADTADSKNALEEYIYDIRNKIEGEYEKYASDGERTKLTQLLTAIEDWLYGEGEESTKSTYVAKLQELKKLGTPITDRAKEFESRPQAEAELRQTIQEYSALAQSTEERYAHIDASERQKIIKECEKKSQWLDSQNAKQAARHAYEAPIITSAQILTEKMNLISFAFPIMNKPKPKPAVVPEAAQTQPETASQKSN